MLVSHTDAVNHPIKLTKPSLGGAATEVNFTPTASPKPSPSSYPLGYTAPRSTGPRRSCWALLWRCGPRDDEPRVGRPAPVWGGLDPRGYACAATPPWALSEAVQHPHPPQPYYSSPVPGHSGLLVAIGHILDRRRAWLNRTIPRSSLAPAGCPGPFAGGPCRTTKALRVAVDVLIDIRL